MAIKPAAPSISPVMQGAIQSAIVTALVLVWAKAKRIPLFERDDTLLPGLVAGLLFGGEFALIYVGTRLARVRATKTLFYELAVSAALLPIVSLAMGEPGVVAGTPVAIASLAYQ